MRRPNRRARAGRVHKEDNLTLDELAKELDTYSGAISAQVRTINLGILGLCWLMLLGDEKLARISAKLSHPALLGISLICLLALVFDLAQYLFGKWAADQAFDAAARSEHRSAPFDVTSFTYRAAFWCYRFKIAFTLIGAAALIVLVVNALT